MYILGGFGRLVGAVETREVHKLTRARLGVESLHISPLGDSERRINKYLNKLTGCGSAMTL